MHVLCTHTHVCVCLYVRILCIHIMYKYNVHIMFQASGPYTHIYLTYRVSHKRRPIVEIFKVNISIILTSLLLLGISGFFLARPFNDALC